MGLQGKYKSSVPGTITGNVREYHSARFLGSDIFRQTEVFIGETWRAELSNPSHIPEAQILSWKLPESILTVVCIQPSLMQRTSDGTLSTLHSSTAMSVTTSEDYGASLSHFPQITGQTDAPHWAWFRRRVLTLKRCFSFSSSPRACSQRVFWLLPFSLYYHKVFILQYKCTNVWFGTVGKSPASHNITNLSTVYQLCN